jgi:predicted transcriptional regulator
LEELMLLSEIIKIIDGKKLWDFEDKNCDICGATDMVSELLAIERDDMLLITGLTTPQMLKAADIMRVGAILIVRGKEITPQFLEMAKEYKIPLILTKLVMFTACGKLFCAGLSDINGNKYGN